MRRSKLRLTLAALPLVALLYGFTPFTQVQNVCPNCPAAKLDVVVMTTGFKVNCNVVAQNSDYYILEKFGEYRAALKTEVTKIEWKTKGGGNTLTTAGDQILTVAGVVYHGSIVEEQAGRLLVIQMGQNRHAIWSSQIQTVHKSGAPYAFGSPPPPAPPAPTP